MLRAVLGLLFAGVLTPVALVPAFETEPAGADSDDPAVWIDRSEPGNSIIIGTNKVAAPDGAVVVFGLDGKIRQRIAGFQRPNNVDVAYGLEGKIDIAVATERLGGKLRLFRIDGGRLTQAGSIPVFAGEADRRAAPMGIGLYRRPGDGAIFAIVSRKEGPASGYLWQYRLKLQGNGTVTGIKVREFGNFSGTGEIEAVAVDSEAGFVYYSDEDCCIRKWKADPDAPEANREVAVFGRSGWKANREGIAIYARPGGGGYVVCTDQIAGGSEYHVFRRSGDQSKEIQVLRGMADMTDGLEVTSEALGTRFPSGVLIAMNNKAHNFMVFRWPVMLP